MMSTALLTVPRFYARSAGSVSQSNLSPESPSPLLTVPEACALLRISRWALYGLIHRRQLTTIKIGSRRLIPRQAVTQLIQRLSSEDWQ